jgi:hypothetical protein
VPGAAYAAGFFEDDEVFAVVSFYEVDGCAYACARFGLVREVWGGWKGELA